MKTELKPQVGKWESGKVGNLTCSLSHLLTFAVLCGLCAFAPLRLTGAEGTGPAIALEPYGVLSWTGINGEGELGAGANLTLAITKNLSLVGFGEANDTHDEFIERFGGGLRYTAYLGRKVSLYGGVGGGYDTTDPHFFVRLPVGLNFHVIQTDRADLALGASYAFDIDGNGKHGTATGRLFFGPTFKWKF